MWFLNPQIRVLLNALFILLFVGSAAFVFVYSLWIQFHKICERLKKLEAEG